MPALALLLLLVGTASACGQSAGGDHEEVLPPPTVVAVAAPAVKLLPAFGSVTFERPVDVRFAPGDERGAYVVEQAGRISRLLPGIAGWVATPFLDIHEHVSRKGNEEGLLGLDFDPHYAEDGHPHRGAFYVNYSFKPGARRSRLSRFFVPAGQAAADPASEQTLLEIGQPYENHNGGGLLFGPDGLLYYSLGDGGSHDDPHGNGQNTQVLLGKLLRLDVAPREDGKPYGIPADNPFADGQGGRPEIFAWGLRNVWRFSFDRQTGALWGGDVGQNRWEYVLVIERGGRYGWNLLEGFERFALADAAPPPDLRAPVFAYPHPGVVADPGRWAFGDGLSITGGCVYRGQAIPALAGFYVFGDYGTRRLWAIRPREDGALEHMTLLTDAGLVTSFTERSDGELLVVDHRGTIWLLAPDERSSPSAEPGEASPEPASGGR